MKKKDEISIQFEALGIPLVDAKDTADAIKQIEAIMKGWDVIGYARAEEELQKTKVIVCKLVKDWVEPYAREGRQIPLVLFSTHPEWCAGTRFDAGLSLLYNSHEHFPWLLYELKGQGDQK